MKSFWIHTAVLGTSYLFLGGFGLIVVGSIIFIKTSVRWLIKEIKK